MRQIIYFSTAADNQDSLVVADIIAVSRQQNSVHNVTGLLVAAGHRYLQIIEGEADKVAATLDRIRRDRRHVGVTVLVERKVQKRGFTSWSAHFDGEPEFGSFATLDELIKITRRQVGDRSARSQLDCLARMFVLRPLPTIPSPWTLASNYREPSALDRGH